MGKKDNTNKWALYATIFIGLLYFSALGYEYARQNGWVKDFAPKKIKDPAVPHLEKNSGPSGDFPYINAADTAYMYALGLDEEDYGVYYDGTFYYHFNNEVSVDTPGVRLNL